MTSELSLQQQLQRQMRGSISWIALVVMLFVLSGCVIPVPQTGQLDTLPPGPVDEPIIAVAPNVVQSGDFISVSGAGWAADETIYVNLESIQNGERIATTVAVTTANEDGRFNVSFFLPGDVAQSDSGELTVTVYGADVEKQATTVLTLGGDTDASPTAVSTLTSTPLATSGSATATPAAATATSTPVQSGGDAQVVSRGLNLRSGPGASYAIIRSLSFGDTLSVLGQSSDAYWLYVATANGTMGWVARPYTNFTGTAPIVQPNEPPPTPRTPYPTPTRTATPGPSESWRGEYFANRWLSGEPTVVRNEANIDFDWGSGSPASGIPNDNFAARWTRTVYLEGGTYRFSATTDDGVRVWLDGELIIDEWREQGATTFSAERSVGAGYHDLRVEYFEARQFARIQFWWELRGSGDAWRGEYFTNRSLSGSPAVVRNDTTLDFDWGHGSPASGIPSDNFSVRWARTLHFDAGTYRFRTLVDDGVRLYVDDHLVIDQWRDGSAREHTGDIYLGSGNHTVRMEYYDRTGEARARLTWERVRDDDDDDDDGPWRGEYWNNENLEGNRRFSRRDNRIDFNWGNGSPDDRIDNDTFSVRWTRTVDFERGRYRFNARADDGIRVWLDGELIIDEWRQNDYSQTYSAERFVDGDTDLRVEYFEWRGGARVRFWWDRIGDDPGPDDLEPYADVNPTSGPAGTPIIVTGGGFPANRPVHVYLGGVVQSSQLSGPPQRYASGVTNRDGNYQLSFVMPATWPDGSQIEAGELFVHVATDNFTTEASDIFEFQVDAPSGVPYLNVNPSSGGPDTPVTLSGGGFPPNTRINAHLARVVSAASNGEPETYGSTTTDAQGNFSFAITIPRQWRGTDDDIDTGTLMVLVATDNFTVQASDSFDYFVDIPRPTINLSPAAGGAGTAIIVRGDGFPADTPISLYLGAFGEQIGGGDEQRYASTVTDRRGRYEFAFTLPATWPDGSPIAQERLVVLVANDNLSVQASESLTYVLPSPPPATATPLPPATPTTVPQPRLSLAPAGGGAGTLVQATGNGFPAGTALTLYLASFEGEGESDEDYQQYAAGTADSNGNYSLAFTMPTEWPNGERISSGRLLVVVATNGFAEQATATFMYQGTSAAGDASEPPADTAEVTPPTATNTATPVPPTATSAPTNTPVPPTATSVPPTVTNTATPVPPTVTPVLPTATSVPPTATNTATPVPPTATNTATATPLPPTATSVPTNTVAPPTATDEPATPTATATEIPPDDGDGNGDDDVQDTPPILEAGEPITNTNPITKTN